MFEVLRHAARGEKKHSEGVADQTNRSDDEDVRASDSNEKALDLAELAIVFQRLVRRLIEHLGMARVERNASSKQLLSSDY